MTTEVEVTDWNRKNRNDEKGWGKEFLDVKTVLHCKHKMCCSINAFFQSILYCYEIESGIKTSAGRNTQGLEDSSANFCYPVNSV